MEYIPWNYNSGDKFAYHQCSERYGSKVYKDFTYIFYLFCSQFHNNFNIPRFNGKVNTALKYRGIL